MAETKLSACHREMKVNRQKILQDNDRGVQACSPGKNLNEALHDDASSWQAFRFATKRSMDRLSESKDGTGKASPVVVRSSTPSRVINFREWDDKDEVNQKCTV